MNFIFFDLFIVFHHFFKMKVNITKRILYSYYKYIKRFQVRSFSNLLTFEPFSRSRGYTHLSTLILFVETNKIMKLSYGN